jgi:hypothetical protein
MSKVAKIEWEAIQPITGKLYRGRDEIDEPGKGAYLTASECSLFLRIITSELKPRRRRGPSRRDLDSRDQDIATLVELYKARGDSAKTAVGHAGKLFGVGRSTVLAACARYPSEEPAGYAPIWDGGLIWQIEQQWRHSKKATKRRPANFAK